MKDYSDSIPYIALASHMLQVENDFSTALQFAGQALSVLEMIIYDASLVKLHQEVSQFITDEDTTFADKIIQLQYKRTYMIAALTVIELQSQGKAHPFKMMAARDLEKIYEGVRLDIANAYNRKYKAPSVQSLILQRKQVLSSRKAALQESKVLLECHLEQQLEALSKEHIRQQAIMENYIRKEFNSLQEKAIRRAIKKLYVTLAASAATFLVAPQLSVTLATAFGTSLTASAVSNIVFSALADALVFTSTSAVLGHEYHHVHKQLAESFVLNAASKTVTEIINAKEVINVTNQTKQAIKIAVATSMAKGGIQAVFHHDDVLQSILVSGVQGASNAFTSEVAKNPLAQVTSNDVLRYAIQSAVSTAVGVGTRHVVSGNYDDITDSMYLSAIESFVNEAMISGVVSIREPLPRPSKINFYSQDFITEDNQRKISEDHIAPAEPEIMKPRLIMRSTEQEVETQPERTSVGLEFKYGGKTRSTRHIGRLRQDNYNNQRFFKDKSVEKPSGLTMQHRFKKHAFHQKVVETPWIDVDFNADYEYSYNMLGVGTELKITNLIGISSNQLSYNGDRFNAHLNFPSLVFNAHSDGQHFHLEAMAKLASIEGEFRVGSWCRKKDRYTLFLQGDVGVGYGYSISVGNQPNKHNNKNRTNFHLRAGQLLMAGVGASTEKEVDHSSCLINKL